MADITMCRGTNCNMKSSCYRFTARPSEFMQSYFSIIPINVETGKCDWYCNKPQPEKAMNIEQIKQIAEPSCLTNRESFEKWYLGENTKSSLNRNAEGYYVYAPAHVAWTVWQAAKIDCVKEDAGEIQQLRNRVAELEEANKLLEADASRYRWLKENYHGFEMFRHSPITLDIEVDKAMENKNEQY